MKCYRTDLPEVIIVEPEVYEDPRGFFYESFNKKAFADVVGVRVEFVQDNHSRSAQGVLRGLHFQNPDPQAKLVRTTFGSIWDVVVDLRRTSPNFGKWTGAILSSDNRKQIWVPEGFAHGFLVLSDFAECQYKTTTYWNPALEHCLAWDDPDVGIRWPIVLNGPVLSERDARGLSLSKVAVFP